MIEIQQEIPCPNCERLMTLFYKRRGRLYRHSEDMWDVKYICRNPMCNTHYKLKYSAKSYQLDINGGGEYNAIEY